MALCLPGQFISIDPNACSAEGLYEIDGSTISFHLRSAQPAGNCAALPAPVAVMENGDIVFEVPEYDAESGWVTSVRRVVYQKSAS